MKKMKMEVEMNPCTCFCMNRLPDEILIDIFSRISDAKKLFRLSIFCKRFASLIPHHAASTITLRLPHHHELVGQQIFLRYKFIASFKKFVDKFRYKHTLHFKLTREFYNVDIFFEFMPDNKPPQVLILSSVIPGLEKKLDKIYYPFFDNLNTTYYFPPLFPGYHACGRWEDPLMMLLSDTKAEEQPWINRYKFKLALPESEGGKKESESGKKESESGKKESESGKKKMRVMLSATKAAWGDDGVFFRNNIRGKDAVLLEAVREVMNWYF